MSITFNTRLHPSDIVGYRIECFDCETDELYPTRDAAGAAWPAVQADHARRECRGTGLMLAAAWPEWPTLNVANGNARDLLEVLGLVDADADTELGAWCSGVVDADDLIGRILVALAVAPDPEIPGYVQATPGRATVVQFDRRAGYLGEKLEALHQVAEHAKAVGRDVTWG